ITLRARMSIRTRSTIKHTMIGTRGILKEVVAKVEDTMVDVEDKAVVVEEVSFHAKHVIHADILTTIGMIVLKILHAISTGRTTIAMKNA
ncbi:hypothetical protein KI387_027056, partial [Taxus chinensis]